MRLLSIDIVSYINETYINETFSLAYTGTSELIRLNMTQLRERYASEAGPGISKELSDSVLHPLG